VKDTDGFDTDNSELVFGRIRGWRKHTEARVTFNRPKLANARMSADVTKAADPRMSFLAPEVTKHCRGSDFPDARVTSSETADGRVTAELTD
jgi:hypothetical protein